MQAELAQARGEAEVCPPPRRQAARGAWSTPLEQSGAGQVLLQLSQDSWAKGKAEGQAVM